jgi:protein MpaA
VIGKSVQGRDITAYRMGDPTGRPVLLIGVIHGNEAKGFGITQLIRTMPTPPGIDLWIIDSINPDGQAANTRQNANGVDLNRNVSWNWNYIPKSADNGQYSGERRPINPRRKHSSRS